MIERIDCRYMFAVATHEWPLWCMQLQRCCAAAPLCIVRCTMTRLAICPDGQMPLQASTPSTTLPIALQAAPGVTADAEYNRLSPTQAPARPPTKRDDVADPQHRAALNNGHDGLEVRRLGQV